MRIAITSDIHYPITNKNTIFDLISKIQLSDVEIVCLGGDVAECRLGTHLFSECVRFFTSTFPNICVVAGNHDLWDDYGRSQLYWDRVIPDLCKGANAHYLENGNFYLKDVAIVGSMLHYDYSAKSSKVNKNCDNCWFSANKGNFNDDAIYLKLNKNDIDFANDLANKFLYRLKEADSSEVKSIIAVTHDSCFECQIVRKPEWIYSNAYFGNISHENDIKQIGKLKHVVSGHSHCRTKNKVVVDNRVINVESVGSDYYKPEFVIVEV